MENIQVIHFKLYVNLSLSLPLLAKMKLKINLKLFKQLPNETQIYYITESKDYLAVEISKIPFTHPSHIQAVIAILRKQLLLNELALSCMRKTCYNSGFRDFK